MLLLLLLNSKLGGGWRGDLLLDKKNSDLAQTHAGIVDGAQVQNRACQGSSAVEIQLWVLWLS